MFKDEDTIELTCPKCGDVIQEKGGSLKTRRKITCHRCRGNFYPDHDGVAAALEDAQRAIDNLRRSVFAQKKPL